MKKILLLISFIAFLVADSTAQDFNLTLRSSVTFPYSCASLWGYVGLDGVEYALVGTYDGVSIIDVNDPDNPVVKFNVSHTPSSWREIKTYNNYAYATNEDGGGLLIIDLSDLPTSVQTYTFTYIDGEGNIQADGHTLWIDENGRLYIFGGAYDGEGATMFDLTADPINPPYLGKYENYYIHDGFVRGDTLWASEIFNGQLEIIDVSNPSNPVPMASVNTPNFFTHNSWPTHDDHYVFTTDEVDNSYLTSYDVSDLSNITELDREQSNPGSGTIIHNVHLYNDQFATVAYYKDGVVLFDVSHPDNMIEVGSYDTDPGESGGGYGGTWGVYPYLPSGNIIASDLSDAGAPGGKLTVLTPSYVPACWLEGNVTDSITGAPLLNVYVEILNTNNTDYSDLGGAYKTGNGIAGTYTVRFSVTGYVTKEISVDLTSNVVTTLDAQLIPLTAATITGTVVDSVSNAPIEGASVFIRGLSNGTSFTTVTDASGAFSVSPVFDDNYDGFAGKWGYHEDGFYNTTLNSSSAPLQFKLAQGYYDDFIINNGWTVSGDASTGLWTRGEPIGTTDGFNVYNPDEDLSNDWGDYCYVTGNGGGDVGSDDVDNGSTTLTSPVFDLTDYNDPVVSFYSWFANGGGDGNPNDTLKVYITAGSGDVLVMKIRNPMFTWVYHSFHVNDFLSSSSNMQVKFVTSDLTSSGHLVEAAIDVFRIDGALSTGVATIDHNLAFTTYPNPFNQESILRYDFGNEELKDARIEIFNELGQPVESYPITVTTGSLQWGAALSPGVYFVQLLNDNKSAASLSTIKLK